MKPWQWAVLPLRRYARFSSRAPRPGCWWFHLLTIAVMLIASSIDLAIDPKALTTGAPYVSIAATIALALPWIAVAVRRLHDANYSWWASPAISAKACSGPTRIAVWQARRWSSRPSGDRARARVMMRA